MQLHDGLQDSMTGGTTSLDMAALKTRDPQGKDNLVKLTTQVHKDPLTQEWTTSADKLTHYKTTQAITAHNNPGKQRQLQRCGGVSPPWDPMCVCEYCLGACFFKYTVPWAGHQGVGFSPTTVALSAAQLAQLGVLIWRMELYSCNDLLAVVMVVLRKGTQNHGFLLFRTNMDYIWKWVNLCEVSISARCSNLTLNIIFNGKMIC